MRRVGPAALLRDLEQLSASLGAYREATFRSGLAAALAEAGPIAAYCLPAELLASYGS